ncbi:MAG: hypothetical protein ABW107_22565, partial [Candidatus Thiodiazotropha sp. 6PLUC5]
MKKFALVALAAALALPIVNVLAMDSGMAEGDAKMIKKMVKRGKKVAIKQCFACHDITKEKQN